MRCLHLCIEDISYKQAVSSHIKVTHLKNKSSQRLQFPSVPWNSSETSVDAAPGHSQHQQFWGKGWDPSQEQVQKPLLQGKISPKYQVAVCKCEKHSKLHPGALARVTEDSCSSAKQSSSPHREELLSTWELCACP